ncbi:MAG: twin-arginine translocation signal domain-containing protein [Anaerolineae bacterium]|nr:twin-arginine translocation signal domain-containing protein [Anaerolineae bacterium]
MTNEMLNDGISRRGFIQAVMATAAAATAVGAGAAWLKGQGETAAQTVPVVSAPRVINNPVYDPTTYSELMAQLVTAQAENVRLQAALDAANRQIAAINGADGNNAAAIQNLRLQLDEANNRAGILAGLVALYDQLDGIDLSQVISGGLTSMNSTIRDLVADIPTLEEAIAAGRSVLQDLERDVPLIESGRTWLEQQATRLETFYQGVETFLKEAVEAVGSFFDLLNQWFQDILKWLPFGMGRKASNVMSALTPLLQETPTTIAGLRQTAVQPMNGWFKRDNNHALPIQARLIQPIRDNALAKAGTIAAKANNMPAQLEQTLAAPVNTVLLSRQVVRDQIAVYRQRHQV